MKGCATTLHMNMSAIQLLKLFFEKAH